MLIRAALPQDRSAVWQILEPVIRAGETYTLDRNLTQADALAYWFAEDKLTFVAEQDGAILGTYYLRANQSGGGNHVCNCGFMTAEAASGRGIARQMCLHAFSQAQAEGYRGMQFNFVVSTNERAIGLWQSLGFEVVGRLPLAFQHPRLGEVDALVMFRRL